MNGQPVHVYTWWKAVAHSVTLEVAYLGRVDCDLVCQILFEQHLGIRQIGLGHEGKYYRWRTNQSQSNKGRRAP